MGRIRFKTKKRLPKVTTEQSYALHGFHFAKKEGQEFQRQGPEGEALNSSTVNALRRKGLVRGNKITAKGEEYIRRQRRV